LSHTSGSPEKRKKQRKTNNINDQSLELIILKNACIE